MASLQLQHSWLSSLGKNPSTLFPSRTSLVKVSLSVNSSNAESSNPTSQNSPEPDPGPVDPVKLAFERAQQYKQPKIEKIPVEGFVSGGNIIENYNEKNKEVSDSVKVAMDNAKEYKKNKGAIGGAKHVAKTETSSGVKAGNGRNSGSGMANKSSSKEPKLSVSSIDFVGLDFADRKKGRGLPAGLVPITDRPEGDLPDVEIIVGDTRKFEDSTTLAPKPTQEGDSDLYKPKVSTWGVFPRPGNISKTFGGGKTIRPGDVLETAEDRATKDEHTKQLIAAYRKQIGLNVDPKVKYECEKALKDGNSLMDSGKLNEALPYYQKVMDKLPFKSEIHGLAALQWSICQDSLSRANEARVMYDKLQSHPNVKVSKRARQFMFGFQAIEMMKVTGSNSSTVNAGYWNYFNAFIDDKTNYSQGKPEIEVNVLGQALPYLLFIASPILVVLIIAVQGGNTN